MVMWMPFGVDMDQTRKVSPKAEAVESDLGPEHSPPAGESMLSHQLSYLLNNQLNLTHSNLSLWSLHLLTCITEVRVMLV